jgi:hypothetical protein
VVRFTIQENHLRIQHSCKWPIYITGIEPGTSTLCGDSIWKLSLFKEDNETFELELNGGDVINFGNVFVNWP